MIGPTTIIWTFYQLLSIFMNWWYCQLLASKFNVVYLVGVYYWLLFFIKRQTYETRRNLSLGKNSLRERQIVWKCQSCIVWFPQCVSSFLWTFTIHVYIFSTKSCNFVLQCAKTFLSDATNFVSRLMKVKFKQMFKRMN